MNDLMQMSFLMIAFIHQWSLFSLSEFAWVTLATNDSYSLGALVVAHSLRKVSTKHQLAVLITPGVSESMKGKLQDAFDVVQLVNVLDSNDSANLAVLKRPELGITFTKLHCWNLTQFEKCVFLDADVLVLQNCDELFEREEFSAAPDVGWPDCFNSGVFVFSPSVDTFGKLVQFADTAGSFDGELETTFQIKLNVDDYLKSFRWWSGIVESIFL